MLNEYLNKLFLEWITKEGESPVINQIYLSAMIVQIILSRVVWDCSLKIFNDWCQSTSKTKYNIKTDREKVLRRKGEKNFEERVKRI